MPPDRLLVNSPPATLRAASGSLEPVDLCDLEDQELRILALAVGDHPLPIELRERLADLRRRRKPVGRSGGRPDSGGNGHEPRSSGCRSVT
jgi:hypothetical protein